MVRASPPTWCDLTTLHSAYGSVRAHVHRCQGAASGAVLVGGIGNDVDGPGDVAGVATVTTQGYDAAGEPKRLVLLEDAGHDIAGHEDEFVELVVAWAVPLLAAG